MVFPSKLKITVLRESGEKENFLLFMDRHMQLCHRYDNLKNEIVSRYPELVKYEEIRFVYVDEEGDEITILNHDDYYDYMKSCVVPTQPRRIFVRGVNKTEPMVVASAPSEESPMEEDSVASRQQESSSPPAAAAAAAVTATPTAEEASPEVNLPVHTNIICDVCDSTIRGHRYKCLQCFNYDLCMRCEAKFRHKDHLMVRIPKPEMNQRGPFRLFEKLRSFAADIGVGQQCATTSAAANEGREDDYENSKRSKRHHRRHSKDRSDSKECREEKERKERKHRRERSAKSAEERRSARRYGHGFNFSHLINQVIDPANIQSAFLSSDAAAAAAAAAAESAQEAAQQAVRATIANCPFFAATTSTTTATSSGSTSQSATTSTTTSAPAPAATTTQEPAGSSVQTETLINMTSASTSTSTNKEPEPASTSSPKQVDVLDFSWLAPTPESIQKINQTFSRILDPLGMNIEIRPNGNSPKPAQTQTPTEEKKDKTTETANTPTTSTPSQTMPTATTSTATATSGTTTDIDPLVLELGNKLETAFLDDPEVKKLEKTLEHALFGTYDEDDDFTDSSVSLLSDNDEAAETSEKSEKRWTLVDIPNDNEEQAKKSMEDVEMATEPPISTEPAVAVASGSSEKTPATPAATASYPEPDSVSSANNGRTSKPIDYEQLGKALKQHLEAEKQAAATSNNASAPSTPASAPKETTPPPKEITPPPKETTPPKVVTPPAPVVQQPPAANVIHSRRPHVNRAVEAMLVMGFSNEGGWLTQLLESVDGDIPRALDLLTPQRMNP